MSQVGTVPRRPTGVHPLRQLSLTASALSELGALLDPLRSLATAALERRVVRVPSAPAGATGARARPSTPKPRPAERRISVAEPSAGTTTPAVAQQLVASLRRPANIAFLAVLMVVLTAWWVELRPTSLLGGPATFITVKGTSMLPTLKTGDFVLAEAQAAYKVGDLVVYRVPKGQIGAGDDLIHRIVAGNATVGFTLKGDNNPAPDPWTVPRSDILGKEAVVIGGFGSTLLVLRSPLFAGLAAALIAMWVVLSPPEWLGRKRPAVKASASASATEPASVPVPEPARIGAEPSPSTATSAGLPKRVPRAAPRPRPDRPGRPPSRAPARPRPRRSAPPIPPEV
ncbi:MAG: signal peptidase I [Candidatus Dormibacteria bacterium]